MTDPHPQSGYARRLGLFDGTMLVMGGIIGAGIFLNPAVVAERTGTPFLAVGVWVLGGVVALAGALCFAELGARKPLAGGGYVYLRDAWGPLAAFLYGWTQLLVINSGGIAAVAMTFAGYAASLTGLPARMIPALAVGAIGLLSLVNYLGIKPGSMIQNLFTVLKLAALVGLILAGLLIAGDQVAPVAHVGRVAKPPSVLAAVGIGLIPVLFAYGGWQSTNFVAGEMRDPVRDLPRALLLGVSGVVITYVLANIVYVRVLGIDGLAASTAPASDVMEIVLGPAGRTFIAAGIAFSTFGFLNLAILAAPRVYQAMAADGVFVGAAAQIDDRFHVPATAIFIQAAWAILLVSTRSYGQLLDYVVFGDWIFFGLVGATLWYYRRQDPGGAGFRLPGYPWVPLFFVTAATFTVISTVVSNPLNALLGTGIIGTGIPAFFWWKRRGTRA
jgi:APA family basic amino acid/polyamine antiporter